MFSSIPLPLSPPSIHRDATIEKDRFAPQKFVRDCFTRTLTFSGVYVVVVAAGAAGAGIAVGASSFLGSMVSSATAGTGAAIIN
jgi:hypothetical protein